MRTIAIVFALTVIAAAAPAAASSLDHLAPALLLFTAAWVALLGGCLVVGWRVCELKARARVAPGRAAAERNPDPLPALRLARAFPVVDPGAALRMSSHVTGSRPILARPIATVATPQLERADPRAIRRAS